MSGIGAGQTLWTANDTSGISGYTGRATTETAPAGALTPRSGASTPHPAKESVMPYPESTQSDTPSSPPDTPALDACPECGQHDCRAYATEYGAEGYVASYDCECCGHHWSTTWAYEAGGDR